MKVLRDEVKDSNWLNRGEKILGEIVEGRGEIRSYRHPEHGGGDPLR